jgi:hypothetical protein
LVLLKRSNHYYVDKATRHESYTGEVSRNQRGFSIIRRIVNNQVHTVVTGGTSKLKKDQRALLDAAALFG